MTACFTPDLLGLDYIPLSDLDPGYLLGDSMTDEQRSEEFKDTPPSEGWADFRLAFLEGTEWDTVGRILSSLRGWNLRFREKGKDALDVQLIEPYDTNDIEGDERGGVRVAPIDEDGNALLSQEFFVAYEDIEEIGIY